MIIEGGSRSNGRWFATHLQRTDQGQCVTIVEARGLAGNDIAGWFRQMEAMALGTRGDNSFYHSNVNPREGEALTEEQWDLAADVLERSLGLDGQPRFIVQHEKDGRTHRHIFWSRVDPDTGTLIRDSHNYDIHMKAADVLEKEFDHERTPRGRGPDGPNPKNHEVFRGKRSGISPYDVGVELTDLWRTADTGRSFAAAVEAHGYVLARGDQRGYVVLDPAGDVHSLAKRIAGARTKDINARMEAAGIGLNALPSVEEARALARSRAKDRDSKPKHDAAAFEIIAEQLAEAVREAIRDKDKERPQDEQHPPTAEAGPPQAKENPSPGPESHDGPSAAPPPPDPSPEPSAEAHDAAADREPPHTRAAPVAEPAAAPQPSLFERLAQKLSQAVNARSDDLTVAEAADLSATRAPPSQDGVPLAPWEMVPPEPIAPASAATASPFERTARELARATEQAAPVLEDLAVIAAAVAGPEHSEFERVTGARFDALREALGDERPSIEAGIDWRARQAGIPYLSESPPEGDLTAFEQLTWQRFSATRDNGGEPVTHDGGSFWRRAREMLAAALDDVAEWARDRIDGFAARLTRARHADRADHERER
jgi:relaxase-like protein